MSETTVDALYLIFCFCFLFEVLVVLPYCTVFDFFKLISRLINMNSQQFHFF